MALCGQILSRAQKVTEEPCEQEMEKVSQREELLMKKTEYLKKRIDQELLYVKRNSRKNRGVALQALKRKKWYEKHLKYIDCAVKVMRSAHEHIDILNKMSDLIKDITEEQGRTEKMSGGIYTSASSGVEFDEDEVLADLERLENNLDESLSEKDRTEENAPHLRESSAAALPHSAKTEEEEIEEALEYLRRWLD